LKFLFSAALLAASLAPTAASAESPGAADPHAPMPRMTYRSVFQDTATGLAPDLLDWKKANAEVGLFPRGHVDLLKWEERQGQAPAPAPMPAMPPKAATPPPAGHKH
jgi:hypothetical protein